MSMQYANGWDYADEQSARIMSEDGFFIGMKNWNATVVLEPHVFPTPGKAVPLPADE